MDRDEIARDIARAADPAAALERALPHLAAPDALHVAESVLHRLPAFADPAVLRAVARAYDDGGRPAAALLIAGAAEQRGRARAAPPDRTSEPATAALTASDPEAALRRLLEAGEGDPPALADLIRRVWGRMPPVCDYWVVHRAMRAFDAAGHIDEAMVMAAVALQLAPTADRSFGPAMLLLGGLLARGRMAAAGGLAVAWAAPGRMDALLRQGLAATGQVPPLPPQNTAGLSVREIVPASVRPPLRLPADAPACLAELALATVREPIRLYRLVDAEVIVHGDDVSVFGADGTPYPALSVGRPPLLTRARAGTVPASGHLRAVILADAFPAPNLCHFLCDQATRLTLYRQAGVALDGAVVIGPRKAAAYQHEIADAFGAAAWIPTDVPRRMRVGELWVVSSCEALRHPADLGAPWAIAAIRDAFGVDAARPRTRRLYVSRRDAQARRVANEDTLLEALLPLGFEVVVPGALTVAGQAALFARATHVVTPHGAGATNIVFCAPGTHVLELFHPQYGTYAFAVLAQATGLDYRAVSCADASLDGVPPPDAPPGIGWIGRDMTVDVAAITAWFASTLDRST